MPDASTLALFFSTVALLIATLTGLVGAFSTFRLQNIYDEIGHLIETMRKRETPAGTLDQWIEQHNYGLLEQIYDTGPEGLAALRAALDSSGLSGQHAAYEYDYSNVAGNHARYLAVKRASHNSFRLSLVYVFVSLVLLLVSNALTRMVPAALIGFLAAYLAVAAVLLGMFVRQLRLMTMDT